MILLSTYRILISDCKLPWVLEDGQETCSGCIPACSLMSAGTHSSTLRPCLLLSWSCWMDGYWKRKHSSSAYVVQNLSNQIRNILCAELTLTVLLQLLPPPCTNYRVQFPRRGCHIFKQKQCQDVAFSCVVMILSNAIISSFKKKKKHLKGIIFPPCIWIEAKRLRLLFQITMGPKWEQNISNDRFCPWNIPTFQTESTRSIWNKDFQTCTVGPCDGICSLYLCNSVQQ